MLDFKNWNFNRRYVERVNVRHCAKFRGNCETVAEIWRFFDMLKMATVRHLGFVMSVEFLL